MQSHALNNSRLTPLALKILMIARNNMFSLQMANLMIALATSWLVVHFSVTYQRTKISVHPLPWVKLHSTSHISLIVIPCILLIWPSAFPGLHNRLILVSWPLLFFNISLCIEEQWQLCSSHQTYMLSSYMSIKQMTKSQHKQATTIFSISSI